MHLFLSSPYNTVNMSLIGMQSRLLARPCTHAHTHTHTHTCTHTHRYGHAMHSMLCKPVHAHTCTAPWTTTRSERERRRAAAAVVRRAKRDGSMATPKGLRATSLTALRVAPVWPRPGTAADPDLVQLLPHLQPSLARPDPLSRPAGDSSSSSSVGTAPVSGSNTDAALSSSSSSSSNSSSSSVSRAVGRRGSMGRGGSSSGRVWPMDPPELTAAISRCANLKGAPTFVEGTQKGQRETLPWFVCTCVFACVCARLLEHAYLSCVCCVFAFV